MSNDHEKITLMEHVVFQPKRFSWVTEVDIPSLEDKEYICKSYQSTMDLSKELQYEVQSPIPVERQISSSNLLCEGVGVKNAEKQNAAENAKGANPAELRKLSERRDPPLKPPRKSKLSVQPSHKLPRDPDVIAISSPTLPNTPARIIMTPPDTPSVTEAGQRMSTFGHNSSFSRPRGHTRSKSESVKMDIPTTRETSDQALKMEKLNSKQDRRSKSITNPLLIPSSIRPKTPTPPRSPVGYVERDQQMRDKSTSHLKLDNIKEGIGRSKEELRMVLDSPQPDSLLLRNANTGRGKKYLELDYNQPKRKSEGNLLDGNISPVAKDQYDQIVKELASSMCRVRLNDNSCKSRDNISQNIDASSNQLREDVSLKVHAVEEGDNNKPHSCFSAKSQVRKSMFISHDEEDSILEDKPLTSGEASARAFGTDDDTPGQGARRFFPPSPRCLSPDNGSGTHSDREESTFSDDTEGSTSTLPCLGIGSDHYKELKRSLDSEKWLATNNDDGKIYYYEESGSKSQWKLPELDSFDEFDIRDGQQTSTLESQRVSLVTENLAELSKNIVKEGFMQRTFILKEGKKVRKNWTSSYARYIVSSFNSGSQGLIHFSKTKDDDKKAEIFDFIPPCSLDLSNDKKTSRQQVIALRNGQDTEVLLQFEDRDIENEWHKVLVDHDGMQQNMASVAEKEEKKGKKGSEKMKRAASIEQLAPDSKGITDKLLNFIKRRPLKETLEKKGIYKEAVFGSTLSELHIQDKTTIPIFVLQCINHIEKSVENLRADGLYRISGNAAQIQKIRYEVAQRNYTILSREKEVHNLSGALKLFFRELKEPLIPFANYQDFIQATGSEYRKKNQQVEKLTKAVRQLPLENYDTMKVLLQHLLRVSEYESENRMSISNLAIVFGPCLLWPRITNAQDLMTDVMLHNRVIEGLLLDYQKIFSSKR